MLKLVVVVIVDFVVIVSWTDQGTGIRGLTRGLANLPQGNWEPLVVKTRMEDSQVRME